MINEKYTANWHSHTYRCKHATGDAVDYAEQAVAAGLGTLGFSEHMPTPDNRWLAVRLELGQMPDYRCAVELARARYPELKIFYGLECEFKPEWLSYYKDELMGHWQCEFLILGAHNFELRGRDVSIFSAEDCTEPGFLRAYTENIIAGIASGLFKMVAHPDAFGMAYDAWTEEHESAARDIAQAARAAGIPLEINTNGIRKPLKETPAGERWLYPWAPFWEVAAAEGAHAIINADAHNPGDVAAAIEPARRQAAASGIRVVMPPDLVPEHWV